MFAATSRVLTPGVGDTFVMRWGARGEADAWGEPWPWRGHMSRVRWWPSDPLMLRVSGTHPALAHSVWLQTAIINLRGKYKQHYMLTTPCKQTSLERPLLHVTLSHMRASVAPVITVNTLLTFWGRMSWYIHWACVMLSLQHLHCSVVTPGLQCLQCLQPLSSDHWLTAQCGPAEPGPSSPGPASWVRGPRMRSEAQWPVRLRTPDTGLCHPLARRIPSEIATITKHYIKMDHPPLNWQRCLIQLWPTERNSWKIWYSWCCVDDTARLKNPCCF